MTDEHRATAAKLREDAVLSTESPARAVSLLMSAAASILATSFSCEHSLALMTQALDVTGAELRKHQVN